MPQPIVAANHLCASIVTESASSRPANKPRYRSEAISAPPQAASTWHPDDPRLRELHRGECRTDNLSPWPGVAWAGERLDHDEFMRRLLALRPIDDGGYLDTIGEIYLNRVRRVDDAARAASIASYEDGGLSRVFSAMLRAPDWNGAPQQAFRFFLEQHIKFDTDDAGGHGSLSRHLVSSDDILPLWAAFREILATAVPQLSHPVGAF